MAKGGAKKVVYEDWTEDCEQGRYHYGRMSADMCCGYCGATEFIEEGNYHGPCKQCGEWSMMHNVKENV